MYITFRILLVLSMIFVFVFPVLAQETTAASPAVVVLDIQGHIDLRRPDWLVAQTVIAGTFLDPSTDLVEVADNSGLIIACPDGTIREFLPGQLVADDLIACPEGSTRLGGIGTQRLNVRRGGRQGPTIPYLIAPRATIVRTPTVELVWNAISDVRRYTLTVRSEGGLWESEELDPASIVQGDVARLALPITLQPAVAYTVEICVLFNNMEHKCTSDADWESPVGLAFYYVPTPELDALEANFISTLGPISPASLYVRAVMLSQPLFTPPNQETNMPPLGAHMDAINLLETLLAMHPDSALAQSPSVHSLLGELYRRVELRESAARAFQRATELALPDTESAAVAAFGYATTTSDKTLAVTSYNSALDNYAAFLNDEALEARFEQTCKSIGEVCLDLQRCEPRMDDCLAWYLDS